MGSAPFCSLHPTIKRKTRQFVLSVDKRQRVRKCQEKERKTSQKEVRFVHKYPFKMDHLFVFADGKDFANWGYYF